MHAYTVTPSSMRPASWLCILVSHASASRTRLSIDVSLVPQAAKNYEAIRYIDRLGAQGARPRGVRVGQGILINISLLPFGKLHVQALGEKSGLYRLASLQDQPSRCLACGHTVSAGASMTREYVSSCLST